MLLMFLTKGFETLTKLLKHLCYIFPSCPVTSLLSIIKKTNIRKIKHLVELLNRGFYSP